MIFYSLIHVFARSNWLLDFGKIIMYKFSMSNELHEIWTLCYYFSPRS